MGRRRASWKRWAVCALLGLAAACEEASQANQPPSTAPIDAAVGGRDGAVDEPFVPDAGGRKPDEPTEPSAFFLELPDPLARLPHGDAQRERLCSRGLADPIALLFCQEPMPQPESITALLTLLGIEPSTSSATQAFALTAHSTALSKRFVSAINPRVVYTRSTMDDAPPLSVGFTRGEPFVEALAVDPNSGELEFYVLAFTLPCMASPSGCGPSDLLTPATESGWMGMEVFHEDDLINTTLDCNVCHRPDGPGTPKIPRMQELENTWSHWIFSHSRGGQVLTEDFLAAHSGSTYGGLPPELLDGSRPSKTADFARELGPFQQPNMFNSGRIEAEVEESAEGQPEDNTVAGESALWQRIFKAAQRGEAIPVPYHNVKVTDESKLIAMTAAYRAYLHGSLPAAELPDIRDVFFDDEQRLTEMGFLVDDRLEGQALLTAACATCHNLRLDQRLSRARFHPDLAVLSRDQKDLAIERLQLPTTDVRAMPPRRTHDLTDETRQRLIDLLRE